MFAFSPKRVFRHFVLKGRKGERRSLFFVEDEILSLETPLCLPKDYPPFRYLPIRADDVRNACTFTRAFYGPFPTPPLPPEEALASPPLNPEAFTPRRRIFAKSKLTGKMSFVGSSRRRKSLDCN